MSTLFPSLPKTPALARLLPFLLAALACSALAAPTPLARFRAQFDHVDAEGHLIMRLNKTAIPVDLYGVTLKIGADGMLGLMLPSNVSLDVLVIQKGAVPKVTLLRGTLSVADDLVKQGYATRP